MRRRRFITFGSIVAMALSLATVSYLVWFLVWHIRNTDPVINLTPPTATIVVWKSEPDEITMADSAYSLMIQGTYTRRCSNCHNRHKYELECRGRRANTTPAAPPTTRMWRQFLWASFDAGPQSFRCVGFPPWLPIPVLAAYPAIYFLVVGVRRLRRRPGCCLHCDYDLTGNESGVCPECGTGIRR